MEAQEAAIHLFVVLPQARGVAAQRPGRLTHLEGRPRHGHGPRRRMLLLYEVAAGPDLRVVEDLVHGLDRRAHDAVLLQLRERLLARALQEPGHQHRLQGVAVFEAGGRRREALVFEHRKHVRGPQEAAEEALAGGDHEHVAVAARHHAGGRADR